MTGPAPDFLERLRQRARAVHARIALPEASDPRVREAAAMALAEGLFIPVLVGPGGDSADPAHLGGVGADGVDTADPARIAACAASLREIERGRGKSLGDVEALARDPLMQAALMVRSGEVDGAVAGAVRTTSEVVRAALVGVGLAPNVRTLSSAFFMVFGADHHRGPSVLTFADAGVVPTPSADQLADIAWSAAQAHERVVGEEPRVAFLSYSTLGSAGGPSVELVRAALGLFRALAPHVACDGELQGDAALVPSVAARKAPNSEVAGRANVLVFPDLASANLSYKLVQYLGGATALGPVLQGLARPLNDLSRGASPTDIVAVACVAALMSERASIGEARS